jgi:hypothetical protein
MRRYILAAIIALTACRAMADEFMLFQSSEAGDKAWAWGQARIKNKEGGVLRITENSPTNDAGDVYVADPFPYLPEGKVTLDVGKVTAGNYTFQVLCYKNGMYFHTAEPISHLKSTNQHAFTLGTLGLPAQTESVVFKIWVSGAEMASIDVNEFTYSDNIDLSRAQLDDHFLDVTPWMNDTGKVAFVSVDGGARLTVMKGAGFGSVTRTDIFSKQPGQEIIFQVGPAESCTVTLQLNVMDAAGSFLQAIDVVGNSGTGTHGVVLDKVKWPDGASSFGLKIWISGKDEAVALIKRLVVFTR